ncbi:MAG: sigma-70 family RNA polymerase sigma factor [Omnitrophica bacterium]|nr:sigma-70 family RNA polymerase sigma factor [Candidatus Omnitrophota bacterium]
MNELELIKRCLKKDKKAWDIFVQQYSKLIYWAIRKRLTASGFKLDQDDINSIFQEVFLSILEGDKLRKLKDAQTIPGWLAIIASNKTVDFMRRAISDERRFVSDMPVLTEDKFKQKLYRRDLIDIVGSLINNLPAQVKIIISLNLLEQRTHKEIAAMMNIPINTVSTIIARTKQKLKEELERKGIADL